MHIGIDLGTSGIKAVLAGDDGVLVGQASVALTVAAPQPLWSEQNPADWWNATCRAIAELARRHDLSGVRGIGLAGQMHGAILLDRAGHVLRPAILWNDGRSAAECLALETEEPRSRAITGNLAMPGFTAPKLLWVRQHEPALFAQVATVLLPKDWLRRELTGELASDMSDASGTLWLDTEARRWSPAMLAACDLDETQMPRLLEGTQVSGRLTPSAARALGLPAGIPVAAGGGDNAAGALGIGCVNPGDALLSLGTSGVIFVSDSVHLADPERTVHAFCHCVPDVWHRMSVILSAAASLAWLAGLLGTDEITLLREAEGASAQERLVFLPYLSGERTPHNDAAAAGVFFGLSGKTGRADLTRAVLEGVAFALADGLEALEARGRIPELTAIGGGARSPFWLRLLASALDRPLQTVAGSEIGPALGAARLGRVAAGDADLAEASARPTVTARYAPEPALADGLARRRAIYRSLYPTLRRTFADTGRLP